MKETTAYRIVKTLRASGHDVVIKDAPPGRPAPKDADEGDLAVVGGAGVAKKDAEACVAVCRRMVRETCDAYTVALGSQCHKRYPDAAFAVW